ncbi:MAG: hypothetical protein KAJ16_12190 [Calditrichia bacterium]|nr:hypothetical protein [Calditrichia bacterium]
MARIWYYIISFSLIYIFLGSSMIYPWGYYSHTGMTAAAAREVFNLDTSKTAPKISQFKVNIKYDMEVDFGKTVGMSLGILGTAGFLESFVGSIIDMEISKDKFRVDETLTYPPPKKPYVNTLYKIMAEAGSDPDTYDANTGLAGKGKMLVGHIYAPNGIGFTDIMAEFCYNNAVKAWKQKNKNEAFVWLSYASHYVVDAGIPVHAEADYRNLNVLQWQLKYHTFTESYVSNNWQKYKATADSAAKVPMPVCDIGAMVRSLAMETYPDLAEWNKAWGQKGGEEYKKGDEPANVKKFDELVKREIWRCVPRIAGLFLKFKNEEMK